MTLSPAELKAKLRGPIAAIPTPFTADHAVDYDGVRSIVELGLKHGVTVYELTAGDSAYALLTYDEIKELTRVLVEAVGGRGVAIAATHAGWWTGLAVDYARFAEAAGADGLQIQAPGVADDQERLAHYKALLDATRLGIILQGNVPVSVIERLVEIDRVVGMKEDAGDRVYYELLYKFGKRLSIFCGGQKSRFMMGRLFGSTGYLSTFATFAPWIAMDFWRAIEAEDFAKARQLVFTVDQPFFDWASLPGGYAHFHGRWRATLEHFGVARRHVRPPEHTLSDEEMKDVARFWDRQGIAPAR
ncbi:MAG: dihydrodipicolinate synthase family protein [Lentisphaerae bacterium]|nr:dihydrodipicolinate synthase family protein [Lentisphaerota bacterium]